MDIYGFPVILMVIFNQLKSLCLNPSTNVWAFRNGDWGYQANYGDIIITGH